MPTIEATIIDVLYPKQETPLPAWFVLNTDKGKATGQVFWRPSVGEKLALNGCYGSYQGERQFKFSSALPVIPVDPYELLSYACHLTKGIGTSLCDAIWDSLGEDWRDIQAGDVPRMSVALCNALRKTADRLDSEQEKTRTVVWLKAHGATDNMALTAWGEFGKNTVKFVTKNPFILTELPHYGFKIIDEKIRPYFNIGTDDPRRIRAGVLYTIQQLTSNGSTIIRWSLIAQTATEYLGPYREAILDNAKSMLKSGELVGYPEHGRVALKTHHDAETEIWRYANET